MLLSLMVVITDGACKQQDIILMFCTYRKAVQVLQRFLRALLTIAGSWAIGLNAHVSHIYIYMYIYTYNNTRSVESH